MWSGSTRRRGKLVRKKEQFVSGRAATMSALGGTRHGGVLLREGVVDVFGSRLRIVELARWDLFAFRGSRRLRGLPYGHLFCDDLSFDEEEVDFRGLKTFWTEGWRSGRRTSHLRHLQPRT
jgi:predicted AAA+ superfamily ATPase